jgi:hypothetical protein
MSLLYGRSLNGRPLGLSRGSLRLWLGASLIGQSEKFKALC